MNEVKSGKWKKTPSEMDMFQVKSAPLNKEGAVFHCIFIFFIMLNASARPVVGAK